MTDFLKTLAAVAGGAVVVLFVAAANKSPAHAKGFAELKGSVQAEAVQTHAGYQVADQLPFNRGRR